MAIQECGHEYQNSARSGNKYVGEFRDNKRDGQGTFTWSNGNKYVGEFHDGNITAGTFTWPNGDKYVGGFHGGTMSGEGTFTWANGSKYVGAFNNGEMNGQGTMFAPDGTTIKIAPKQTTNPRLQRDIEQERRDMNRPVEIACLRLKLALEEGAALGIAMDEDARSSRDRCVAEGFGF